MAVLAKPVHWQRVLYVEDMTTTSEPLVRIDGFKMTFGRETIIDDLSFDIHAGETFGFLGSNGCGKTTTIRALLGIYRPTAGILHINGKPFRPEDGSSLGYLPEERGLYKKESVIEVMMYFGRLKGFSHQAARDWSMKFLERMSLADKAKVRIDKLSSGQQQKVQLGVTVMNSPELLILDEPTKGFDPVNRRLLMEIIEEQKNSGSTVLMVTHQMEEVERLCDRVIFLKGGRAEAYGSVDQVQDHFGGTTIRIKYSGTIPASTNYTITSQHNNYAELVLTDHADRSTILRELVASGLQVREFTTGKLSLDDIFIRIYGHRDDDDSVAVA